uniref:MD-2-related lipid-recognition domain-containing protein n=1 Tax=Glossina austeni TaxID=7395 RepID=A0A1A9UDJ1_GLOAU
MKTVTYFAILGAVVLATSASIVKNCAKSKSHLLDEENDVNISNCPKNKCSLKRNTDTVVEIKLKPKRDFKELNSDIQGIILDVPIPFLGYYGTSACPHIYDAEGKNVVGCPLKAGETYIYRNSFKILPVYPTVSLVVHWGLGDSNDDVVCFEVPAKIKA